MNVRRVIADGEAMNNDARKRKRNWSKNRNLLKSIPNPSKDAYEIKTDIVEKFSNLLEIEKLGSKL